MKIKSYVRNNPSSLFSKFISFIYWLSNDFNLFIVNLTGYFPSHVIRHILYRHLFRVKIPTDSIIYWKCKFFEPKGVKIGHNSIIGNDAFWMAVVDCI